MLNDSLKHWGIPKMKWGTRRYQNPDGTYTEEGKRRRRKGISKYLHDYNHEEARSLSSDELRKRINRYSLENQYRELARQRSHPKLNTVKNFVSNGAKVILTAVAVTALADAGRKWMKESVLNSKSNAKEIAEKALKKIADA